MTDRLHRTCWIAAMLLALSGWVVPVAASDHPVILDVTVRDLFPLHEGDRWLYQDGGRDDRPPTIEVAVVESYPWYGSMVHRVQNYCHHFATGTVDFLNRAGQTQELYGGETGTWYPWADPASPVVLPEFCQDCMRGTRGRILIEGTVHVPAGTFDHAVRIQYEEWPCMDDGVYAEIFAPGIGLVERQLMTIAGLKTMSLVYARIDGREFGAVPLVPPGAGKAGPVAAALPAAAATWGSIKTVFAP